MGNTTWTPDFSEEAFNKRLENAFRRVSGSIGFELSRDLGNSRNLKNSASNALQSGMDYNNGPLFMRMGKGALDIAAYKPGGTVDLKECAGEILREFFEEGKGAYLAVQAELHAGARAHLLDAGCSEAHVQSVLATADAGFTQPEKEDFSKAAADLCHEIASPVTKAVFVGALAFAPVIALMRNPIVAVVAGVAATLAAYYFIRNARVGKVQRMLHILPRRLYDVLHAGIKTNARRYADTVNAAAGTASS